MAVPKRNSSRVDMVPTAPSPAVISPTPAPTSKAFLLTMSAHRPIPTIWAAALLSSRASSLGTTGDLGPGQMIGTGDGDSDPRDRGRSSRRLPRPAGGLALPRRDVPGSREAAPARKLSAVADTCGRPSP